MLYVLRQQVRDQLRLEAYREDAPAEEDAEGVVKLLRREFEERAREYGVASAEEFYESDKFKAHGFSMDADRVHIMHPR